LTKRQASNSESLCI